MTSRQIEMTWRCTSCGAKTLGRFKKCQQCGNPKDGSEEYEMPDDPSKAASVTEASLLLMASAGPDWRCAYCGSDQRRTDKGCNSCGASALEGEEVPDAPVPVPVAQRGAPSQRRAPPPGPGFPWGRLLLGVVGLALTCMATGAAISWNKNRPREFEARVAGVKWERVISVSRYQAKGHEGFKENIPQGALAITSLGKREHHREDVLDHYETERYSVQVPDGYRTESYTERVSCGQDCTSTPKSCSEKCTSNKNGFATCKTTCSGGGRSCTTKYCNERRTKQVPKTRSESRTRQVPRYRSEPRYAEAFSWTSWEWLPARTVRASGTDVTVRWPDSKLNESLGEGEKEREDRRESYAVTIAYDEQSSFTFTPADEDAFRKFPPGTKHTLHTEQGQFQLDGAPVTPGR